MLLSREDYFKLRIERVRAAASLYDLMTGEGHEPRSRDRSMQMRCGFTSSHEKGFDRKPSARYYPAGERDDYETYYCFYCTPRPLDAIGYMMRAQGLEFMDALRFLERRYSINYDDIEFAADIGKELDEIAKQKTQVDPWRLFQYCEEYLRENRERIGMSRFVRLSYALDMIYYLEGTTPEQTVTRLEKWKSTARRVVNRSTDAG